MKIIIFLAGLISFGMIETNHFNKEDFLLTDEYDQVLHFVFDTESNNLEEIEYPKWLETKLPNKLDKNLAKELFDLGYKRRKISRKDFDHLNQIFTCKPVNSIKETTCWPIYRDILIFRKKRGKEVKHIVQICFECNKANFIGVANKTSCFGQRGEFHELEKFLK